ncbi:hypothetical protein [Faecalicatena contorta]|uniref:Uncharacterized protein n=1 Tax=Faecalicatena contorta TaxID=39482 RepID=A0A316A3R1_9FIRM|nr:hypothetical protein [Faecalicatena contorta]PWJ51580.1 hypothetical protein A8805_102354 [Faecalicatena contorta]SUQ13136.1 hypothetical protein SAMN05216529_102354 [Faecalicatena contorta]
MERCNIFYSWQSDIKESKNFLSDCLKQLNKKLRDIVVVEVDRDTEGIAGAPDNGDTIYMKIDKADIFVADVTIINSEWDKIILLYNKDYGNVEDLPFDINHQRMTGYSLQEEKKAEARNRIISNIATTISILKESKQLHGGRPNIMSARQDLAKILLEGIKRIHNYTQKRRFTDWTDLQEDFIVVTDANFALAETLKEYMTDSQYIQLIRLLQKMKLSTLGNNDHCGWEFAEEIADEYFEPLYLEFGKYMTSLSTEQVLCKEFITLYNAVSGDEELQHCSAKTVDGNIVFVDDGEWQEAYDIDRKLLCKGSSTTGLFTGYRYTREYDGDFVESKRNGKGNEKTNIMNRDQFRCGNIRKSGLWKNDKFIKGTIYSAIIYINDEGNLSIIDTGESYPLTADQQSMSLLISGCSMEELSCYYVADIDFNEGEFQILEGTKKSLIEADVYGYYETSIMEEKTGQILNKEQGLRHK